MKKAALLAFGLSAIINTANAQFYLRAGAGYAFPQAGQVMSDNSPLYTYAPVPLSGSRNTTTNSYTYNVKSASFSSGAVAIFGLGYMFSDHIGVQLDGSQAVGGKKYTFSDNNYPINYSAGAITSNITTTQQAHAFSLLIPSLVLQTGGEKLNVYSRFGLALPISAKIDQEVSVANAAGTGALVVDDFSFVIKSSFSMGVSAAAGMRYNISDRFSVWGELSLLSLSMNVKQADFTNFSENGASYPVSQIGLPVTVKYSKTASLDSTGNTALTYSQPFSNLGVHVGFAVRLSEKKGKHSDLVDDNRGSKNFKRRSR